MQLFWNKCVETLGIIVYNTKYLILHEEELEWGAWRFGQSKRRGKGSLKPARFLISISGHNVVKKLIPLLILALRLRISFDLRK